MAMSRLGFDALAAAVLAATALLGACMPALLASRDRRAGGSGRSLSYVLGNMLSAGVMVSAGFCHLLGDAMRMMPPMRVRAWRLAGRLLGYCWDGAAGTARPIAMSPLCSLARQFPLAPFLCGTGYMLTLLADKAVASAAGHGHAGCGHGEAPSVGPGLAHGHRVPCPAADSCCAVEVLAGEGALQGCGGLARRCRCCRCVCSARSPPADTSQPRPDGPAEQQPT